MIQFTHIIENNFKLVHISTLDQMHVFQYVICNLSTITCDWKINKALAPIMTTTRLIHNSTICHVESRSVRTRWHQRLCTLIWADSCVTGVCIGLCHILQHKMQ